MSVVFLLLFSPLLLLVAFLALGFILVFLSLGLIIFPLALLSPLGLLNLWSNRTDYEVYYSTYPPTLQFQEAQKSVVLHRFSK